MSTGDDLVLDPQAVLRSFSSSFRGYDADQVDAHLRSIADALRTRSSVADSGSAELDRATADIERLSAEVASLQQELVAARAEVEAVRSVPPAEAAPFDEARAMQLLGEETTKVLETARSSAATIVAKAEADARHRTEAVDELQARVNREMAELRKATDTELAEARTKSERDLVAARAAVETEIEERNAASLKTAEERVATATDEAARILADAQASADKLAEGSEHAAATARREADQLVATATSEAEEIRSVATADAATARAEADTAAARIRAEAEADALAAQESARETARLMVVEAQRVREKVLSDLVDRRRQGRQQVDQAKAARDRLARALNDVRRQLDASVKELDVALPEAKAALSALATPEAPTDDEAQIRELEEELDAARARAGKPEVVVATGSAALPLARRDQPAAQENAPSESTDDVGEPPAAAPPEEATAPVESGRPVTAEEPESDATAVAEEADHPGDETDSPSESDADGADDGAEEPEIEVPAAFQARDIAMTRHGADLRRKLKRVMADEQSDLLDRLQRSKDMSLSDLVPAEEQRAKYADAVAPAIQAAASAGAEFSGGSVAESAVEPLISVLVAEVFDSLRQRVEASVASASDVEDVLEPLRAHYRDVRLSHVPDLTDDALAEAFALGARAAVADGTPIRWLSDPRFEPSSDCFDDTLADDVVAPDAFPTGRTRPTGQPGCRCLVLPAD